MEVFIPTTIATFFASISGCILYYIHKHRKNNLGYSSLYKKDTIIEKKSDKKYICKNGIIIYNHTKSTIETVEYCNPILK